MKALIALILFTGSCYATPLLLDCNINLGEDKSIKASLLSNLELQLQFKQGKVEAGLCNYQLILKRNELDSKFRQIKIKYKERSCQGLSKSFRPRKEVTLTFAPQRQKDGMEIFALQDKHPLICLDKNFNELNLVEAMKK